MKNSAAGEHVRPVAGVPAGLVLERVDVVVEPDELLGVVVEERQVERADRRDDERDEDEQQRRAEEDDGPRAAGRCGPGAMASGFVVSPKRAPSSPAGTAVAMIASATDPSPRSATPQPPRRKPIAAPVSTPVSDGLAAQGVDDQPPTTATPAVQPTIAHDFERRVGTARGSAARCTTPMPTPAAVETISRRRGSSICSSTKPMTANTTAATTGSQMNARNPPPSAPGEPTVRWLPDEQRADEEADAPRRRAR